MKELENGGRPVAVFFLAVLLLSPCHADGGYFSGSRSVAVSADQRAIVVRNGGEISLTLSTGYTGDGEEFGWVIPTPVPVSAENVSEAGVSAETAFRVLERHTAPAVHSAGGGCFPAGTEVLAASGPRRIETVEPGTMVYSCDLATGRWVLARVIRRFLHNYQGELVTIQVGPLALEATANHPFYVLRGDGLASRPAAQDVPTEEQAGSDDGRWVESRDLRVGDVLMEKSGEGVIVTGVASRPARAEVYNLAVEGFCTYAVGQSGVLVHNKGGAETGSSVAMVKIHGNVALAHYQVSILSANSASALLNWLLQNQYHVNPAARSVLGAYVAQNWAFVAVKLNPGAKRRYENEFLPALTIGYRHDQLIFPLRISSVSTAQTARLTLYVIAESTVSSSNFPTRVLRYNTLISGDPESYVDGCMKETLGDEGLGLVVMWKGQLLRETWNAALIDRIPGVQFPKSRNVYLTRLETTLDPVAMTDDVRFVPDPRPQVFRVDLQGHVRYSGSADGPAFAARFDWPKGITTDGTNLYVADSYNHTIRKIVISTGAVTTIAGSAGLEGFSDGLGGVARFAYPSDITTDGATLYVTDMHNNAIRKVVIATGAVTTIAGHAGKSGSMDGTSAVASFYFPVGIATDGVNLYIADLHNATVRKIVIATGAVTTIAGRAGQEGFSDGSGSAALFHGAESIAVNGADLYVADANNFVIRKVVVATGAVTTFAGWPGQSKCKDGAGTSARFSDPMGITTDGANLYVADSLAIRKIVIATGVVTTIAGSARQRGSSDGVGGVARFYRLNGIATDAVNLYVTDTQTHTVRQVAIPTGNVITLAGPASP